MIPATWSEHRRADDGELVGYVVPSGAGLHAPVTLFGYPLDDACDEDEARDLLDAAGFSVLAEPWLLTLDDRAEPVQVQVVEVTPLRVVLQSVDLGSDGEYGRRFVLDVPVAPDRLWPARKLAF